MYAIKRFLSVAVILGTVFFLASMKGDLTGSAEVPEIEAPSLTVAVDENGKPTNRPKKVDVDLTRLFGDKNPRLPASMAKEDERGFFSSLAHAFSGGDTADSPERIMPSVLRGGGAFRSAGGAAFRKVVRD